MRTLRAAPVLAVALVAFYSASGQTRVVADTPADPSQTVRFNIFLPLQNPQQLEQLVERLHTQTDGPKQWLTRAQFKQQFGPSASDEKAIQSELAKYGITVISTHTHGLQVQGKIADIEKAFGTKLWNGHAPNGSQRLIATEKLSLPSSLVAANAHVLAFSPVIRRHAYSKVKGPVPQNRYSNVGPYWFTDLKQAYNFPSYKALTGKGTTIAILMANDFSDADMALYFGHEKLPVPNIIRVPVDGGAPFDPNGGSFEISLDLQQSGGMAPGATILDYNIPDLSDGSVIDGLLEILAENQADIVSMSFGGAEDLYTAAYNDGVDYTGILKLQDEIFEEGNSEGITFVTSSGDNGALGLPPISYFTTPPQNPPVVVGSFQVGIEEPADSPHVTAVGGTNLITTYAGTDKNGNPISLQSKYVSENAEGDPIAPEDPYGVGNLIDNGIWGSGGGISNIFKKAFYQNLVDTGSIKYRTIPDVSLHMGGCPVGALGTCPEDRSADLAVVDGEYWALIGTSASAPDFAGVMALEEENLGSRLGNVNFTIYALAAAQQFGLANAFHQGIPSYNGHYSSGKGVTGYNLIVGNGTLSVRDFIFGPNVAPAGNPKTPSNP